MICCRNSASEILCSFRSCDLRDACICKTSEILVRDESGAIDLVSVLVFGISTTVACLHGFGILF